MKENTAVTINGKFLKQAIDTNETAHAVLLSFANRERFRRSTNISATKFALIQKGINLNLKDYFEFFKKLEDGGYGKIIYGKNGKYERFDWNYNLKSVGKAAIKGTVEKTQVMADYEREVVAKFTAAPMRVAKESTALVYIPLRSTISVEFELPRDITAGEINAIKAALDHFK